MSKRFVEGQLSLTYEHHSVDIVDVPVLPSPMMDIVPRHRNLRAVKYGRFVHVVPDVEELGRVLRYTVQSPFLLPDSRNVPSIPRTRTYPSTRTRMRD